MIAIAGGAAVPDAIGKASEFANEMTSDLYNENDSGFLLSRSMDGDLSVDEARRLELLLAESVDLRREAARLEAVNELVQRWGQFSPQVDWMSHESHTIALAGDSDATETLDSMLARWSAGGPDYDERSFAEAIAIRIQPRRHGSTRAGLVRWGGPLAAAAVFLLVVSAVLWQTPPNQSVAVVQIGRSSANSMPSEARSVVSFARDIESGEVDDTGIGLLTLGSSNSARLFADASPL